MFGCIRKKKKKRRHVSNDIRQLSETSPKSYAGPRGQYYYTILDWLEQVLCGAVVAAEHIRLRNAEDRVA